MTTGISLSLLKSRDAAQKGTTKNGTFLQKAGRMLDPYLPARTISHQRHNKNPQTMWWIPVFVSAALTDDHPWDENNLMCDWGAGPQQPQATIGLPAWTENKKGLIEIFEWTHSARVVTPQLTLWTCGWWWWGRGRSEQCLPSMTSSQHTQNSDEAHPEETWWNYTLRYKPLINAPCLGGGLK